MFGALISTVMSSLANVFWKKALNIGKLSHASMRVFGLMGGLGAIIICVLYVVSGRVAWGDLSLTGLQIMLLLTAIVVGVIYTPLDQQLFQREKMSVLMPFTNLNKIFSIIASYFLFQDVSILSFWIIIGTVLVVVAFSVDLKHFKMPAVLPQMTLVQLLVSARYLLMSYVILEVGDAVFFLYDKVLYYVIIAVIVFTSHVQGQLTHFSRGFYINRFSASLTGAVGAAISLYLIAELGASIVLLLGFLQVALILILAYFYLGEKPSRRDILMTVIVTLLVGIGFYFR